jgi:putative addiction module killer protein
MIEVRQTDLFANWFDKLKDLRAQTQILRRIERLQAGNPGDVKSLGGGLSEMRITHGPGYRLYFTKRGNSLVLLLCGGDKASQRADIRLAQKMVQELGE